MLEKLQDRTVRIGLPLENNKYSYFSGYVLADGLIITCYHGFAKTRGYSYDNTNKPILIRSFKYPDKSLQNVSFKSNCIEDLRVELFAFYSEDYDVAVMCCDSSIKAPVKDIYQLPIKNRDEFDAGGYPTFNNSLSGTPSKGYNPVYGEANDSVDGVGTFSMTVKSTGADQHCQWKAISGGPVLIKGQLAGVIKEYKEDEKQLVVVSLSLLLEHKGLESDQSFREFINTLKPPASAYFENRVEQVFQQSNDNLAGLIRTQLKLEDDQKLLVHLLTLDREQLLTTLEAFSDKQVGDLACLLLSLSYANEALEKGLNDVGEKLPYFELSCARQEACELLMAFHSERDPILYVKPGKNGQDIISAGKYCINTPPEHGISGPSAEEISRDLLDGKAQTSSIAKRLYQRWNEDSEEEYYEVNEWIKAANILLKQENGKYYWRLPRMPIRDTNALTEVLQKLPLLKIVKVNGDIDVGESERQIAKKLKPLLTKQSKTL